MDVKLITEIAEENMKNIVSHSDREKGWTLAHGKRTAKLVINLRKKLFPGNTASDEVLYTAALFHDIGRQHENHEKAGAILTKNLLDEYLTSEEMDEISYIISNHNTYKTAMTDNLKLVQDADIIDHHGAMFIWLTMHIAAEKDISVEKCLEMFAEYNTPDNTLCNGELLNFDFSKEILKSRYAFEQQFFEKLSLEQKGIF